VECLHLLAQLSRRLLNTLLESRIEALQLRLGHLKLAHPSGQLALQLAMLQRPRDRDTKLLKVDRFHQVVVGALAQRLQRRIEGCNGREDDEPEVGTERSQVREAGYPLALAQRDQRQIIGARAALK